MFQRSRFSGIPVLTALLVCITAASCKKDDLPVNFHYKYFPLEAGRFQVYSVREVNIDAALEINDTSIYFMKTVVGDTLTDNEGRIARRFERYVKDNPGDPWVLRDIWTAIIDGNRAELVEENQRVIKLVFSPNEFKEWNANAYNMLDQLECYYEDIHVPGGINNLQFDSTLTVEQQDYFTLIDFRRKYERYAKGVGMYYRHFKDYSINNFDTLDITKGKEQMMWLIDYGVE